MYKSLQIADFKDFSSFIDISDDEKDDFKKNKSRMFDELKQYLLDETNTLSAEKIQDHLFPNIEADIFLSHAHADEDKVIELAICLEKIGFKVFVDSCVWGNAFELLKEIDNTYCKHTNGSSYSYESRNFSTANVYMILNTALHRMIEKAELFIFLGTENSIYLGNSIEQQESLVSPWIFSELSFVNQVRRYDKRHHLRKVLIEKSESIALEDRKAMDSELKFTYVKPCLDYTLLNRSFERWLEHHSNPFLYSNNDRFSQCEEHIQALEKLYELMQYSGKKRKDSVSQQSLFL